MQIDLSNKIAVVTGGTSELGRSMVRTLASCAADVAIHYRSNKAMAEQLSCEVAELGRRSFIIYADITDEASVMNMQKEISVNLGDPDIIVNNAANSYVWKPILEQELQDYENQFRTCVLHNVLMAKAFTPAMIKKLWGRVIAINTECVLQCFPTQSAYVSGKSGMNGTLQVLAKEIGKHQITVNQIAPGWMISDRDRNNHTEKQSYYDKSLPLKHRGQDQDVANLVAFLASDLAQFITGAFIPVNGGGCTIPEWMY